jgi:hypothetical protein
MRVLITMRGASGDIDLWFEEGAPAPGTALRQLLSRGALRRRSTEEPSRVFLRFKPPKGQAELSKRAW